ncbi:PDZ domain-containing protein [Candidatus Falkowbacteria bacterium]|nr:PDZ domain-containing protein [Candidatus Falkowbacteria bacterium]
MKMNKLKVAIFGTFVLGFGAGAFFAIPASLPLIADSLRLDEQTATVQAIKKVSPSVVSIDVYLPKSDSILDLSTGQTKKAIGKDKVSSGTGFIISADGLIITNKHVVDVNDDKNAEYKVTLQKGKQYYAQLIGKDPINDLAILKIFDKNLPFVELGDSDKLSPGMSVVAIGNVLGIYQDSVTKGIVSGLNRDIVANNGSGKAENLGNVLQTDAEINFGNSGGPLVDLNGKVIGLNVAMDSSGSSIGFAIPINDAKPVIKSAREVGRIIRPRLGIRYVSINETLAQDKKLGLSAGAWVDAGESGEAAVAPGSPADKAGIKAGDIITEINGIKLDGTQSLISITQRKKPGDVISLKIWRDGKLITKLVTLDSF